jgi:replicative DNA helicase
MNAPANINHAALGSIELEQEVLGAALINSAFEVIERAVSAGDFSEHLHSQLFETFAAVHASQGIITPAIVIASMGGDASTIVFKDVTLGQYIARLAAEACLPPQCCCLCQADPRIF